MDNSNNNQPVLTFIDASDAITQLLVQYKKGEVRAVALREMLLEWGNYSFSFALTSKGKVVTLEPHYEDKFLLPEYLAS